MSRYCHEAHRAVDALSASAMEARLQTEFDAWFEQLQKLSTEPLAAEDWTERWFDGYSPSEALEDGPDL